MVYPVGAQAVLSMPHAAVVAPPCHRQKLFREFRIRKQGQHASYFRKYWRQWLRRGLLLVGCGHMLKVIRMRGAGGRARRDVADLVGAA